MICLIWKSKQTTQASIILFKISKNLTESSSSVSQKYYAFCLGHSDCEDNDRKSGELSKGFCVIKFIYLNICIFTVLGPLFSKLKAKEQAIENWIEGLVTWD